MKIQSRLAGLFSGRAPLTLMALGVTVALTMAPQAFAGVLFQGRSVRLR